MKQKRNKYVNKVIALFIGANPEASTNGEFQKWLADNKIPPEVQKKYSVNRYSKYIERGVDRF